MVKSKLCSKIVFLSIEKYYYFVDSATNYVIKNCRLDLSFIIHKFQMVQLLSICWFLYGTCLLYFCTSSSHILNEFLFFSCLLSWVPVVRLMGSNGWLLREDLHPRIPKRSCCAISASNFHFVTFYQLLKFELSKMNTKLVFLICLQKKKLVFLM